MGVSLVRSLAQIIYGVMSSQEEIDALAASQQVVQQDYLEQVNEEKQKAYEEYVKGCLFYTSCCSLHVKPR